VKPVLNDWKVFTETPLHVAAAIGSTQCVALLLEHGADVRVQFGAARATALHLAAEDGNAECAALLLAAGADPNARNARQQTPLHLAALAQSAQTVAQLLNSGALPNARDHDGRTPLHGAIVKESRVAECARLLIQVGYAHEPVDVVKHAGGTRKNTLPCCAIADTILILPPCSESYRLPVHHGDKACCDKASRISVYANEF